MPGYRCYFLGTEGTIAAVEDFDSASDTEAENLALHSARPKFSVIELWQAGRKVCTLSATLH